MKLVNDSLEKTTGFSNRGYYRSLLINFNLQLHKQHLFLRVTCLDTCQQARSCAILQAGKSFSKANPPIETNRASPVPL